MLAKEHIQNQADGLNCIKLLQYLSFSTVPCEGLSLITYLQSGQPCRLEKRNFVIHAKETKQFNFFLS